MKYLMMILATLSLGSLTSCAAGAATAGYALKAQTSDCLTAEGEQRIVDRAKREILNDIYGTPSCDSPTQNSKQFPN